MTRAAALAALFAIGGCAREQVFPAPPAPARLSETGLYAEPLAALRPQGGVLPYDVASPLWSDGARKQRLIALPPGETLGFDPLDAWSLPLGATLVKTFYFPYDQSAPDGERQIVETRLLRRDDDGLTPLVYLWREDQTDAELWSGGTRRAVRFFDTHGDPVHREYAVPNANQCRNCHERGGTMFPLGVMTAQLNREVERGGARVNQLRWLGGLGALGAAGSSLDPPALGALANPYAPGPVEPRARSWLHANCAHCHRLGGGAGSTGLTLLVGEGDATHLGVCKPPVAAGAGTGGHDFDVVPGKPDDSIMPFRIASTAPNIKMPELPNRVPDPDGLALVRAWIGAMPSKDCAP